MDYGLKVCLFGVNTIPANALAPLSARPSADMVRTKFRSHICAILTPSMLKTKRDQCPGCLCQNQTANALAVYARWSSLIVLNIQDKLVFIFHEERYQLTAPSQCREEVKIVNIFSCFFNKPSSPPTPKTVKTNQAHPLPSQSAILKTDFVCVSPRPNIDNIPQCLL